MILTVTPNPAHDVTYTVTALRVGEVHRVGTVDERPGGKFATADLIGVPWQLTIGPKGLADGVVELKRRATGEKVSVPLAEAIERLTA